MRAGYSPISVNVGLVTESDGSTPSPRATPCTKQVFPAPSGPRSATTSPGRSSVPSRSPQRCVAAASGERTQIRGLIGSLRALGEVVPCARDAVRDLARQPAHERALAGATVQV